MNEAVTIKEEIESPEFVFIITREDLLEFGFVECCGARPGAVIVKSPDVAVG